MTKTIFYVFKVNGGFISVSKKSLKLRIVKKVEEAGYWTKKSHAKSWFSRIKNEYPDAILKEATLKLL